MPFIRRNVNGVWKSVFVDPKIEEKIRRNTLQKNAALLKDIRAKYPNFTENEILALFATVSKHYHYRLEDYVDWAIENGKL